MSEIKFVIEDEPGEQWQTVPVEPTAEMLAATSWPECAKTDYAHMLAAAPKLPATSEFERRVSALRGVITRQKKLVKEAEAQRDSLRKAMHQLEDMKPGILMAGVISRALEVGE